SRVVCDAGNLANCRDTVTRLARIPRCICIRSNCRACNWRLFLFSSRPARLWLSRLRSVPHYNRNGVSLGVRGIVLGDSCSLRACQLSSLDDSVGASFFASRSEADIPMCRGPSFWLIPLLAHSRSRVFLALRGGLRCLDEA